MADQCVEPILAVPDCARAIPARYSTHGNPEVDFSSDTRQEALLQAGTLVSVFSSTWEFSSSNIRSTS